PGSPVTKNPKLLRGASGRWGSQKTRESVRVLPTKTRKADFETVVTDALASDALVSFAPSWPVGLIVNSLPFSGEPALRFELSSPPFRPFRSFEAGGSVC